MTQAPPLATVPRVEIIAHRGASHDAPENTLAAVRLAWSQDADAVEVDVHLTRDERLAVIHDPDTRRTARAAQRVGEVALGELQQLDAGAWKAAEFAGEAIPSLDAVLTLVPAGKRVFIEVKSGVAAVGELVRCLTRSRLEPGQVVVISFDLEVARRAKRLLPRCEVGWIVERESEEGGLGVDAIIARAREARLDALDLEAAWVDAEWVKQARAARFKLYVWTVDDESLARHLVAFGVDGITTNRPGWLREQLRTELRGSHR